MFTLGAAIYVVVLVLLAIALRRGRREQSSDSRSSRFAGTPLVVGGGLVLPVLVMALLTSVTAMSTGRADAGATTVERSEGLTSELQSLMRISYARFSLEKINTNKQKTTTYDDRR